MPDVLLFLKASVLSVSASAVTVLALMFLGGVWKHDSGDNPRGSLIMLPGFLIGAITGFGILDFHWVWPPSNALNRYLELILPAVFFTELLACSRRMPSMVVLLLRGTVAAVTGRVLLHGSVYLPADSWVMMQKSVFLMLVISVLSLMMAWRLLIGLAETRVSGIVSLALAMSIQTGGAAIMLAGYIKGGVAAIPLASSLAATALTALLMRTRLDSRGLSGVAVVSLYCLVFIGCYFGALRVTHGLLIFFAPCLCLVSRLPVIRSRGSRTTALVCLALVSLPLAIVLIQSTIAFRERMAPLLSDHSAPFRLTDFNEV